MTTTTTTTGISTPSDGGKPYRWLNPDGSVAFDLPELTRRVRNGHLTDFNPGDSEADDERIDGRILTVDEWESVCTLLDLLPAVYVQRDQARGIAMQLEEELALLRAGGTTS